MEFTCQCQYHYWIETNQQYTIYNNTLFKQRKKKKYINIMKYHQCSMFNGDVVVVVVTIVYNSCEITKAKNQK